MTNFYCITLPATPERAEHAKEQFSRAGVPVQWVYGVDAIAHGIKPALYMHRNTPDQSGYYISPGACALVLSHYMAWRYAERERDDFVVFEDDVILPENFLEQLEEIKRQARSVKSLGVWLEYCCVDPSRMEKKTQNLRSALPLCTAAVWYEYDALPILFEAIQPAHAPVDILLQKRACGRLNATVTDPQMCSQMKYNDTLNSTIHRVMPTAPPEEIA